MTGEATQTVAARVTAKLHKLATEPLERVVLTLDAIKAPPALAATVMEHIARLATDMAVHYRSKDPRP